MTMMEESSTKQIQQTCNLPDSRRRIKVNNGLLPFKAFYFFYFSALGSTFPYIGLFFKQLQLSSLQTGLLVGLRPFVQSIAMPIWGFVADKINVRKVALLVGTIGWILTYTSITIVHTEENKQNCSSNSFERADNMSIDILNGTLSKTKGILSNVSPGDNNNQTSVWQKARIRKPSLSNASLQSLNGTKSNKYDINHSSNGKKLFLIFFLIIAMGNFVSAPTQTMANIATLQAISNETYKYGRQRLFGSIGWGTTALIVGLALGLWSRTSACDNNNEIDYKPCFYVFGAMMTFALIAAIFMKLSKDDDESCDLNVIKNVKKHVDFTTGYLLLTAAYCGFVLGLIETFLFWHLHDLGGSQILFSLITSVNSMAEMFGFFFSQHFIERFGHLNVIAVGLFSSAAQTLCYGLAKNPWIVLSVEVFKSLAVSSTWAALLSYIGIRPGSVATLQTILHAFYWGFGYASGGVIGGIFINTYGAANVFLAVTLVSCIDAFFLILIINKKNVCFRQQNYQKL